MMKGMRCIRPFIPRENARRPMGAQNVFQALQSEISTVIFLPYTFIE